MSLEILNTGTELLLGRTANSDLLFLGRNLFSFGLRVARQTAVPDGETIRDALQESFSRSEIILITGGLGPTSDDLTRDIVADLLGLKLETDSTLLAEIEARFTGRGKPMPPNNARQAQVPSGAIVLPNPNGTAPGLYLPATEKTPHLFLLPGPPRELNPMFINHVVPILKKIASDTAQFACRNYLIAGLGESRVEELVGDSLTAISGLELGYCAHPGEVEIRCIGGDAALAQAEIVISEKLRAHLVSADDRPLETVIVETLTQRGETLATAESCTGGLLAHSITNVPGASAVFLQGFVTYSNAAKTRALCVKESLIASHNAVSEPVARAMAENAREISGATYALSTTGFAGPDGDPSGDPKGASENPVGTVFIALATPKITISERHTYPVEREIFKQLTVRTALDLLRRQLR